MARYRRHRCSFALRGAQTAAKLPAIIGPSVFHKAGMMKRRQLLLGAAASAWTLPSLVACGAAEDEQAIALVLRRPLDVHNGDSNQLARELVRFATLAPSSHNTQCWRFKIHHKQINITPDLFRRCPAVDPDDHHLFVSLGCATENLALAALANGLQAEAQFSDAGDGMIEVDLVATKAIVSPRYQAIATRQCTRADYDGRPLAINELRLLEQAGSGDGVRVQLLTAPPMIESVLEYVVAANTAQMNDPRFVAELKEWIRFGSDEALRAGDGLFVATTGNPAMPRWLGSRFMNFFFTPKSENERYARQIRNAAGIAVFISARNDKRHWIEAGRCYERFALQATALGIRNAFLNQPVEVGSIRPQFAAWLGLNSNRAEGEDATRPDLVVRFGRGTAMPMSMRRPVEAVLI